MARIENGDAAAEAYQAGVARLRAAAAVQPGPVIDTLALTSGNRRAAVVITQLDNPLPPGGDQQVR